MDTFSSVIAKIKEKKPEYIIAGLTALAMPLFVVIWRGWLFGLLARNAEAISRQVLGAAIGLLLILVAALIVYILQLQKEQKQLQTELIASKAEPESPPFTPRFGVKWDAKQNPHCPSCSTLLSYTSHTNEFGKDIWGFYCVKCDAFIRLNDDAGNNIELKEARRRLASNESDIDFAPQPPPAFEPDEIDKAILAYLAFDGIDPHPEKVVNHLKEDNLIAHTYEATEHLTRLEQNGYIRLIKPKAHSRHRFTRYSLLQKGREYVTQNRLLKG